ncbi:dTDP-4-dehydrorhamnose reductase [Arenibacter sp. TNZ]|jgi:dTDP-4-dehydrorhamnose reductase|uniref:dTDP-4-dehydrorhamnose reductase n=1 Tax=Arenibacter TaxID=178469 RepID=UPI000CD41A91|nr:MULTISPECIES: dTDP-4-dehydrorhamnose reductase [Arenibacter]MCM4172240.1 dTDP-4-dehydrorhamnose reductase [Arenibacter sp. TNZ]
MEEVIYKKIKLLITGANGQLGRCLQDLTRTYPNYDFHFKTSKELDVTSKEQIDILFAQEKFDYCINCAAYTAVDKAETDQESAFLVNAEAVKYLAEACKAQNSILIHISTDFVFDGSKTIPYLEKDVPNPINVYGASKLKGEQYVQKILEQYFIIRTSWVYSEYGHNFVKTMLRLGAEREELSVVDDQLGSPTNASDLAEAIMKIVCTKTSDFGFYHYSNEGEINWYEFAKAIFEIRGMNIKIKPISSDEYPTPAKRPAFSVMDKSKTKQVLKTNVQDWRFSLKKYFNKI